LEAAGVSVVVCGGWGVDALLGSQSRPHDDLDVWVPVEAERTMIGRLAERGFTEVRRDSPVNYVLGDRSDRRVDVHVMHVRADGSSVYDGDEPYVMPATAFVTGAIGGVEVRCVSAAQQMLDHSGGYEPGDTDFADMRLLHDRLATPYLPPFG
jgi:lincosamide nucleotidyltransferase A/C/D/E